MSSTGTGTSSTSETQALVNAYTNSNSMDDRAQANMEGQGRESRLKVLTPKANELYEDSVRNHSSLFEKMWADLDTHLQRIRCEGSNLNVESLVNLGRTIREGTDRLEKLEGSFFEYLKRKNTENSLELLEYLTLKWHGHALLIEQSHKELDMCIKQAEQQKLRETAPPEATPSEGHSRGSRSSRVSSVFSVTARKRAKAEAERARLLYAEEEAVLKKRQALLEKELAHSRAESDHRKADIKVELELLSQKKELAAATAEVKALEDLENASEQYALSQLPMIDPKTRTKAFVEEVASFSPSRHYSPLPTAPLPVQDPPSNVHVLRIPVAPSTMNPDAPAFIPTSGTNGIATDLTRFLLKKDLLLSRLTNFNDKAESFQAWKASFQSVMLDLGVTPREEIDLLEKWTGPESRKHVISLKASNYGYPERGLERIWDRLGERYGAPEVIEASLKQRLVTFPKITPKDYKKLFELSDLASEIESLREDDRFKTLLGYYDSSTGVSPIVSKLPGNLQEKWTNAAVNYMRSYDVTFPPFSFFAKFLRDLSKVRNNPSFVYDQPGSTSERTSAQRTPHDKRNISVRKTSTESLRENDVTAASKKSCFLHNVTSHTLNKCKAFLAKSIENRKKFLRDKKVCFRCCESTSHISRNCDAKLPCSECSSDPHCTALHFTQQSTAELSVNGEESGSTVAKTPSINVNCTQICGNKFRGKSCAKIVLVDVYHQDRPSRRVRLYSMIDDQSNMSLARPEVFDQLGVQGHQHNYVLSSVSGVSNTSGRECSKIVVESVDRSESLVIPVLLECDRVPEIRDEIPTPEVARNYAHLCDIAHSIPPIDDTSHIWMLIGRDVIKAHHVLDQRIGPSHTPYAQKLPLGWVIIGETCLGRTHIPDFVNVRKQIC